MKEMKIEIPAGCEVYKIETQDGHIVVTYKEKERKLPKSWEVFCEMFPIKSGECFIYSDSEAVGHRCEQARSVKADRNVIPDRATAEAVLALCQLIQLRKCFNGDWVPDWDDTSVKYTIEFEADRIFKNYCKTFPQILYFKTKELRDKFLSNFRPLIEKLKPLYGIKEGGDK